MPNVTQINPSPVRQGITVALNVTDAVTQIAAPAQSGGVQVTYLMRANYSTVPPYHFWTSSEEDTDGSDSGLPDPQNLSNFTTMGRFQG